MVYIYIYVYMLKIVNILKQIPNTDANNTNLENKVF